MDQRFADYGIEFLPNASVTPNGDTKTFCPRCRGIRKPGNRHDHPLSVNIHTNVWNCKNCGWKGGLGRPDLPPSRLNFEKPDPLDIPDHYIYVGAEQWFKQRGISRDTLDSMSITATGQRIHFPYYLDGELVNRKQRLYDLDNPEVKKFKQETGARHTWYNVDAVRQ